jgi:acetyltransferase-like isoleucine patch superfamily enzyme
MKRTHDAVTGRGSSLRKYQDVMVGSTSLFFMFYFEWCMLLSIIPGAMGMALRKIFWPGMFGSCGRGVMFGAGIVVRNPKRIHLGDNVVISEQCILDGRSPDEETAIRLDKNVIMSNQVMLSCKNGTIAIGADTGINAQTIIQSTSHCPVKIGRDCIIGQQCFIVGGGSYNYDQVEIPIREQGIRQDGGVDIRDDVWLGGRVTVLGGVTVGSGAVIGAGAVVPRSVPSYSVSMGIPAKVVKNRKDNETGTTSG